MKLRFWQHGDPGVADLDYFQVPNEGFFVLVVADGFGLADGFRIIFCEDPIPEPDGTICLLSVMRLDEPLTAAMIEILRGRELVARERLRGSMAPRD
jgi:hypothetical protein